MRKAASLDHSELPDSFLGPRYRLALAESRRLSSARCRVEYELHRVFAAGANSPEGPVIRLQHTRELAIRLQQAREEAGPAYHIADELYREIRRRLVAGIRPARISKGMGKRELGQLAGCNRQVVTDIETKAWNGPASVLLALWAALGLEIPEGWEISDRPYKGISSEL